MTRQLDVAIIGGGAAGLFAALAARGTIRNDGTRASADPHAPSVTVIDGSRRLGQKILISGGGRCNITNRTVNSEDYLTGDPRVVRNTLLEFPTEAVQAFFESRGLELIEEPYGKLFPSSAKARDVLDLLSTELELAEVPLLTQTRAESLTANSDVYRLTLDNGEGIEASAVVVATGGLSIPKTGSDGFGLRLGERLNLAMADTHPALTPILLAPSNPLAGLSGMTLPAILTVAPRGTPPDQISGAKFRPRARAAGSVLVTHHGITGPAALDVSGACTPNAIDDGLLIHADFWTLAAKDSPMGPYLGGKLPGSCLRPNEAGRPCTSEAFFASLTENRRGTEPLTSALGARLPKRLVHALLANTNVAGDLPVDRLSKANRQRVYKAMAHAELEVVGTDGYAKAEVTAGGVRLSELDRRTFECKSSPKLYFCGEVLDATGRLGGFNFQWAWSSGYKVGCALFKRFAQTR